MIGIGETPYQEGFLKAVKKLESVTEEKLMTLAEYLKPDIFKRGLEKGLSEGLEKGRKERDSEIAKVLLLKGINIKTVVDSTGLSKEEIKKLLS